MKRHSMRDRPIVQLSYPTQAVDNHGKTQGMACVSILDKQLAPSFLTKVVLVYRPQCAPDQPGYGLRSTLTFQGIIQLSTGRCNAC